MAGDFQEELHEARVTLQTLQSEWDETLDDLEQVRSEMTNDDLFSTIDYLTFCDQLSHAIYVDLKDMDNELKNLKDLKKRNLDQQQRQEMDDIISQMRELRSDKYAKMESIDEEYFPLAEETLRHTQDVISQFAEVIQQDRMSPSLYNQINQNLEKELFLQELRDSLESYREAREELIAELEEDRTRKAPEDFPEDFDEEHPELDSILSQLDTAITECDTALLIQEIGD